MATPVEFVELEVAKAARGLRLVTVGGIPSPWSEAAKALFVCKEIPFVAVRLNPAPIWEARTQTFAILTSTDGKTFTPAVPDTNYEFTPDTGNLVRVDFSPTQASHVRLVFTTKSSARSNGAQAAEICIFE